jgi:hypothetical protein
MAYGSSLLNDVVIEVVPRRVHAFDQRQLLAARSSLDLLLARNGGNDILVNLVIDETDTSIALAEAACGPGLMFRDPADEIAGGSACWP